MENRDGIICSIVAIIFGVVILLTGIFTHGGTIPITLGAVMIVAGIGCLVLSIVNTAKEDVDKISITTVDTEPASKTATKSTTKNKTK